MQKNEVRMILGEEVPLEEFYMMCKHGPNSTLSVPKGQAFLDTKFQCLDGTISALRTFEGYLEWDTTHQYLLREAIVDAGPETGFSLIEGQGSTIASHIGRVKLFLRPGNKITFVPKSYKSLRSITIEGTLNQYLQQGAGGLIAKRLKSSGLVDLEIQADIHRSLVHRLSVDSYTDDGVKVSFATIDWSQASDRIWTELVRYLLPAEWFALLADIRSEQTEIELDGKQEIVSLPMIGSMGNGFTFPLETLIFLVLLRAIAAQNNDISLVSVFGDDCIIDSKCYADIQRLAIELGWQMNADKSFSEGCFKESCGVDSFKGKDVRPFFIERPVMHSKLGITAWLYNCYNLTKVAVKMRNTEVLDSWLLEKFKEFDLGPVQYVPNRWSTQSGVRTNTPDGRLIGDSGPNAIREILYSKGIEDNPDSEKWVQFYEFRYIGIKVEKRTCTHELGHYHLSLKGISPSKSFKRDFGVTESQHLEETFAPELDTLISTPSRIEPGRSYQYAKRKVRVYRW